MMSVYSRPYRDETDYQRMRDLLSTSYTLAGPPVYCTLGDLDWWRCTDADPQAVQRAQLWFTEADHLVAFAWPSDQQVDLVIHPDYRGLDEILLAWAEANHHRLDPPATEPLVAWGYTGDTPRISALTRRGYSRTDDFLAHNSYTLDRPIPAPRLPEGYHLRHMAGEVELAARVAIHRAAFAPSQMSEAKHRAVMQAPTYRPDLDLVAVAPDGSLAAFALVWYDATSRLGLFEPVGCHPDHQRRGLATALLYEGLRRLDHLGAQVAYVNSGGPTDPGAHLYQSAGFTEIDRNYGWEKSLRL